MTSFREPLRRPVEYAPPPPAGAPPAESCRMNPRVLLIIDCAGRTTKEWYIRDVVITLRDKHVSGNIIARAGAGLEWMYTMLKDHVGNFDHVVIVSCGNTICTDHLHIADIADILTQRFPRHHLVLYGGASELWEGVRPDFEERAGLIRDWFYFAGVLCVDGRELYSKHEITRCDVGRANCFYGTSRDKAVAWLTDVVMSVFSANIRPIGIWLDDEFRGHSVGELRGCELRSLFVEELNEGSPPHVQISNTGLGGLSPLM